MALSLSLILLGCGGGGDGSDDTSAPTVTPTPAPIPTPTPASQPFKVGGSLSGLEEGTQFSLLNNGADTLKLTANGAFTFATAVTGSYAVTIGKQPIGQTCSISNGTGVASSDISNVNVVCAAAPVMVSTFAGSGASASADGTGTAAAFKQPAGAAIDTQGNIYVSEFGGNKIRKISPAGIVTTLAGSGAAGAADGTGNAASFSQPVGVAVDASGNVYVADASNNKIRKITPAGDVATLAGSGSPGSVDGTGSATMFNRPYGIAVDGVGNLYVSEYSGNKIRKVSASGVVTTLAGSGAAGSADGNGVAASFNNPNSLTIDTAGNLYVADASSHKIRKITPQGVVSTFAGSGSNTSADGTGTAAAFSMPFGLTMDSDGSFYVTEIGSHKIRKITPSGVVTTLAGKGTSGSADGAGASATFNSPVSIVIDGSGKLYVTDHGNNKIRLLSR